MPSDTDDEIPLGKNTEKKEKRRTVHLSVDQDNKKRGSYVPPGYTPSKRPEKRESSIPTKAEWNTSAIQSKSIKDKIAPSEPISKTVVKSGKRTSKPLIAVEENKRESRNPLLHNSSASNRVSWMPPSTVIKRDLEKGDSNLLIQAKRAEGEAQSYFVSPKALAIIRLFFGLLSASFVAWYLWDQKEYFFNQILGWHWLGLFGYFMVRNSNQMAFFKSHKHVTFAQESFLPFDTPLFDILFICTSSFSFLMVALYWIFIRDLNFRSIGQWAPFQFQTLIGYHLGVVMMLIEIFLSCHMVVKIQAIAPPLCAVLYIFQVWVTHYIGGWPWPLQLFPEYFEKSHHFMFLVASFAVTLLAATFGCMIVYALVHLREYINEKKLGVAE
jgi:hypothetical protein